MSRTVIIAPSADIAKTIEADVTVEAEYGSVVAKGSVYTAAHHQPGMENLPAPCVDENIPTLDEATILVSHLDLDTIGGVLRVFGSPVMDKAPSFWKLAAFVDKAGPHKLGESGASETDIKRLYAFWAWMKKNVEHFSRDEATIITETIIDCEAVINEIIDGSTSIDEGLYYNKFIQPDLLRDGEIMREDEMKLNRSTFITASTNGKVLFRITSSDPVDEQGFCNHLYNDPDGETYAGVVAWDKFVGSITISLDVSIEGVSCREIMQEAFGPEAGGHDNIAGSPRETKMSLGDAADCVERLSAAIEKA
tara:strand:+ start:371 stop:1294 length:924 start_codon:yes stop_codon:yes gene_type:complete